MPRKKLASMMLFSGALLTACEPTPDSAAPGANTVYRNGRLYTLNPAQPWADAVAISDGRIVAVGSEMSVAPHIGQDTTVVDLNGRLMLPGLQDSHIHPIGSGMEASVCDLNGLNDVGGYRSAILNYATNNPDVPWILGGGWSMSVFGPGAMPSRLILDELVPNRPVYLSSQDGHTGWANSAALALAGITRDTPDPVDGRIDRDPETGEPIGSLQEGAMQLVAAHIPKPSQAEYDAGLQFSINMLNGYGITSIQDASVEIEELTTYAAAQAAGALNMRVVGSIWWDRERGLEQVSDIIELRTRFTSGLIDAGTVKIMQDGVMENYTAAMLEPYKIPSGSSGIPMIEPEFLKQIVSELDRNKFQVHFHAIGDAGIRQSLDAIETALDQNGQLGNRHHISHLQIIQPEDIPRFKELEVVANFQPLWAMTDPYITELTLPFISEATARWMYPIKSVLDAGGKVAFGSDWSVTSANPYQQIETAVLRKDSENADAEVFLPQERIDLESAIAAFTINAAFVNRLDQVTGSIEVGKFADLVVLDQNLFEIEPELISDTQALLTLFQGKPVHGTNNDL